MKTCPYCGKEYPNEVAFCLIDHTPLSNEEPANHLENISVPSSASPSFAIPTMTERKLCIAEIIVVCMVAFSGYILSSIYWMIVGISNGSGAETAGHGIYKWLTSGVHELTALALLWYLLARRGETFSYFGLKWKRTDIAWAFVLWIGAAIGFRVIYYFIELTGLTSVSSKVATAQVGHALFNSGITVVTILFTIVNPFFEELVARAYVMTEVKALTNSAAKAVIISTLLQTSYHLYQGVPMALSEVIIFLIFSIFYARTNRIWPVILAHLFADLSSTLWYLFRQLNG